MSRLLQCALVALWLAPEPAPAQQSAAQRAFAEAESLYQQARFAEALAAFQNFETGHRFSALVPQAIYYQGWCWFSMRRFEQAANTFERLLRTFPDSAVAPEAMLKQAECFREMNNPARAVELYRAFQKKFPGHDLLPQAMLGEAWMLYKQNDLAGAKAVLHSVSSRFPNDPVATLDALFLLGQILSGENDPEAARAVYRKIAAQRDNPRATEGLFMAGEAMFEAKRYADAVSYFKRVQSKAALLQNIEREIRQLEAERPQYLQRGALTLYATRREALRQLQEKFQQGPELRSAALFRIANCYQALGRPEEASVVYRYLLNRYPQDKLAEQAHFGLVQTLTQRGQLQAAEEQLRLFQQKYPTSAFATDALFLQAEAMFGSGRFAEALERFQKFAATNKNPQLLETAELRIAESYLGLGEFEKARSALLAFLQKAPRSKLAPEALFRLGRLHYELSQKATEPHNRQPHLREAVKAFEQIRAQFPTAELLPEVTFQLGYLYSYLTEFGNAVAAFEDFSSRWPDHRLVPEAIYQIGRNHLAAGHHDQAVAAFRRLLERYSGHELAPFAAFEIAGVHAAAGRPAEMIAAYRQFAQSFPDHPRVGDALYAIGAELENQKKFDDAIAGYRALIARAASASAPPEPLRNAAIAAQLRIAAILESQGAWPQAVADCETFLARFSADPLAVRAVVAQIASLYRKAKQFSEAHAKLEALTAQYRLNPAVRVAATTASIELALAENDIHRAYAGALKLLADPEKDRLPAVSYLAIGNTLLKRGEFAQARDSFQKALTLYGADPRTAPLAQLGLAQASLELNDLDAAEAAFGHALADPQSPARAEAELGLARVYEARGRTREAVELYNKVMAGSRGEAAAQAAFRLARMTFAQKDYKLALAYYLRVALIAGGEMGEEAAFRSAQCHEALGNLEAARNAYTAYLRRFPNGKFAAEARDKLSALPAPKPQA
jgi:TolA-binding protein